MLGIGVTLGFGTHNGLRVQIPFNGSYQIALMEASITEAGL